VYLLTLLIVTSVWLVGTIGFLAFLWYGDESNPTWQKIALANWVTRSVTLAAIVLRASISLQAGVATSMLAAIILETAGVKLRDLPELSMMRFTNTGPFGLLWTYGKQKKYGGLAFLLIMLVFSTLAAQLSSTLLLSDVVIKPILGRAVESQTAYGFGILDERDPFTDFLNDAILSSSYWEQKTTHYPAFGEYSITPTTQRDGVDDTGTVIRAMIPITEQTGREKLKKYEGPGFLFDARTVCVKPRILSLRRGHLSSTTLPISILRRSTSKRRLFTNRIMQ